MDYTSRYQYMTTLRQQYAQAARPEKGRLLDEYCRNTGQDRKYAIKLFNHRVSPKPPGTPRKKRPSKYGHDVVVALVRIWEIFDCPCGQRLAPLLTSEVSRLRALGELYCTDEVAARLMGMAPSTIDERLRHEKEVLRLTRQYRSHRSSLLCQQVPMKIAAEQERTRPGHLQVDCVEHGGMSAAGDYVNSLSLVDIFSGWWEGEAVMGKGQARALTALAAARQRSPVIWREIHPDNGTNIMNYHLYRYAQSTGLNMSRSRPYRKNDNCFVEQKNATHIRQVVGYLRYDTEAERQCLSDLYRQELRLFKNFCQPVMKLTSKTRVGGKIKKTYDKPCTPYERLLASPEVSAATKAELRRQYISLNPAELKRMIDAKLARLLKLHQQLHRAPEAALTGKKLTPLSVSFYPGQPRVASVSFL